MLKESGVMKTEVIFNESRTERFLLRKVWDESKAIVSLIMLNPSSAEVVTIDMTVHYAICNLYKLNYGGVEVLNITSTIASKLDTKDEIILSKENLDYILESAKYSDKTILAWGRCGEGNKKISDLQMEVIENLYPYKDKIFVIASESGESGFHPLAPIIRHHWDLKPLVYPKNLEVKLQAMPNESESKEGEEIMPDEPLEENEPKKSAKGKKAKKNTETA